MFTNATLCLSNLIYFNVIERACTCKIWIGFFTLQILKYSEKWLDIIISNLTN